MDTKKSARFLLVLQICVYLFKMGRYCQQVYRSQLKCKIIGAMKDAGLLKSDYQTIAEKIDMGNELPAETHANYMGYGKAQPYFEWICDNVKG